MIYVSCRYCTLTFETTSSWRVESDIKEHIEKIHPERYREMRDEEERYNREIAAVARPKLNWGDLLIVERLLLPQGRKEYPNAIVAWHRKKPRE